MSMPCSALTIVVVDDDASFRSGLAEIFNDDGHRVHAFADPPHVSVLAELDVSLVITDYRMAAIDGVAFADGVHATLPHVPVLLVTAYWAPEVDRAVAERHYLRLYRKAVAYDELHALVHELAG